MDPRVTAAIIGAVATLLSATIAVISNSRRKRAESSRKELESALSQRDDAISESAPYKVETLSKSVSFDEDGTGEHVQKWLGITPNQRFQDLEIPFFFSIEGPRSELGKSEAKELDGCPLPVQLLSEPVKKGKQEIRGKFQISGYCDPSTHPISFYWKQQFKRAFAASREEAQRIYQDSDWKTEYSASTVIAPTNNIRISVAFPKTYDQKNIMASAVAFIGGTHHLNKLETQRIMKGFQFCQNTASLDIRDPIIGMRYAVVWMPPSSK